MSQKFSLYEDLIVMENLNFFWRSLAIVAAMPVAMTLLFGYGVALDTKHVPMCVFDREGSQASQDLLKHFQASEYFNLVRVFENYNDMVRAIDSGECNFGIVVPYDFAHLLKVGGDVPVQALVDATNDNTTNLIIGYNWSGANYLFRQAPGRLDRAAWLPQFQGADKDRCANLVQRRP